MAVMSTTSVADLDSEDRVRVLGIIDQFRALGINEDISLPQLVVVGDQSSGKSSLLEGLTGLNFPIASELCTRFATQIVLRRSPHGEGSVKVSILPGPSAGMDDTQRTHLESFSRCIDGPELSADVFANILDEAAAHMGLPTGRDHQFEELPKRFSADVLKIELSGPEHHHLSVVDVPGLFHNPTRFQTQEDLEIIRSLLERYVTDKRTIILAVMDARNNLANQEVFRMARAADPGGKRTVGIITKCDALQPGDEESVLTIAQNQVEYLTHGWFCVKNRSTQDIQNGITIKQRHANEKAFFNTHPWSRLARDRVGIHALKKFLGKLLYDHIRGEFPALVDELRNLAQECRAALDQLGPPRQTAMQQRQFLSKISAQYQQVVSDSLRGNYDSTWGPEDPRKLRMRLHILNNGFADALASRGHLRPFRKADNSVEREYVDDSGYEEGEQDDSKEGRDIYAWIRRNYRESRGAELPGLINPAVMESLFRQQAKQWRTLADEHLTAVEQLVTDFNDVCFQAVFADETVRQQLSNRNAIISAQSQAQARRELDDLWNDEMGGPLQTVNHYYADNLAKARLDRLIARLKDFGIQDGGTHKIKFADLTNAIHLDNEDQAVFDIHDMMKAYYKVARKRFSDSVVLQVIERCYLSEGGPVHYITPSHIGELTDSELGEIAGETYITASTRNDTSNRLERLERALIFGEGELRR